MFALALALFWPVHAPPCDWATGADASKLTVRALQEEPTEARIDHRQRPDEERAHDFEIRVTREARGPRCLRVGWRAAPRGKRPASAADFHAGRWPSGTIDLPGWPTRRDLNPPMVEITFRPIDDGVAEPNETLGFELLDRNGRVIWGSESWSPEIIGRSVLWNYSKTHRNGVMLAIHDVGRECSIPGPGSGFSIDDKRARLEDRQYYPWPGIFIVRPDRPITQCEVLRWRLVPGGRRPLHAGDFKSGQLPRGTLRFNSSADSGPDSQEDELMLQFSLRRGVRARGRTATIILESARGTIARRTLTLN